MNFEILGGKVLAKAILLTLWTQLVPSAWLKKIVSSVPSCFRDTTA